MFSPFQYHSNRLHENPLHSSKTAVWCAVSRKQIVGPWFFEETITVKNYRNFRLKSLLCWKRMSGITGLNKKGRPPILRTQQLSYRTSLVIALSGVEFDHHDPQTLRHLTSFCGDFVKKECTEIIQEAWKTLYILVSRLLPVLTNKLSENCKKQCEKCECLFSRW